MKKLLKLIRCRECKEEVLDIRDHWADQHGEKLKAIDHWLGKQDDKMKEWERVVKRQEKGEEND